MRHPLDNNPLPGSTYDLNMNEEGINWESQRAMEKDVEENEEMYNALATETADRNEEERREKFTLRENNGEDAVVDDSEGGRYKTLTADKSGGEGLRMDEIHWWSLNERINYIKTTESVYLMFLWGSIGISFISGYLGYWQVGWLFTLIIVAVITLMVGMDMVSFEEWKEDYE